MRRVLGALALGLCLTACNASGSSTAAVGAAAPAFSTHDLSGHAVRLADYRGKTVVLNFWASWCVPCRSEFPLLAQVAARPGTAVLGVVYNDSAANARAFIAAHGGTWPGLVDDGQIAHAYRVGPGIPATIVIGPDGKILRRHLGQIRSIASLFS